MFVASLAVCAYYYLVVWDVPVPHSGAGGTEPVASRIRRFP